MHYPTLQHTIMVLFVILCCWLFIDDGLMNDSSSPVLLYCASPSILIIDKPSSIPVHPAGQYRHNSLSHILWHKYGIQIRCVHRLVTAHTHTLRTTHTFTHRHSLHAACKVGMLSLLSYCLLMLLFV